VLFEILTGSHPFPGLDGDALVAKHLVEPLPSVVTLRLELPQEVDKVIQKATRKEPQKRFENVDALAQAFHRALAPGTTSLFPMPTTPFKIRNPYKGLSPFQEADAPDFFGREELVYKLLHKMKGFDRENRFLAVVGPSGSGKSSLVKAGLIPALRDGAIPGSERWFIAEMTPGDHPLSELEAALLRIAIQTPEDLLDQLQEDPDALKRILREALPGIKDEILLVIDQFEETFTLVQDRSERSNFLDALARSMDDPKLPFRVLITLRADFYDRPLQHPAFGQMVQTSSEVVLPLSSSELERAICGPAERIGLSIESALMARIIQEISSQPGALPLLQYTLTELFEHRQGNRLTQDAYEASGGVLGALGHRAETIFTNLDKTHQLAARQLFLRLVTLGEGARTFAAVPCTPN